MVYGMSLGDTAKAETVDEGDEDEDGMQETSVARAVPLDAKVRPFYYCVTLSDEQYRRYFTQQKK